MPRPQKPACPLLILLLLLLAGTAAAQEEKIFWGDLHAHTNDSLDAWAMGFAPGLSLDDAGLFAVHCASLDFYALTEHADTPTRGDWWSRSVGQAAAVNRWAALHPEADGSPPVVVFPGYEWTHHHPYGHRNVIFKHSACDALPEPRGWFGGPRGIRPQDLLAGRRVTAAPDPMLLEQLLEECGKRDSCAALVIPHGNAWGQFTFSTDWQTQVQLAASPASLHRLIEVYSKHGNSEEYRAVGPDYRFQTREGAACVRGASGCDPVCQPPTSSYEPCCWRAGEIVRERCLDPQGDFCARQIALARRESRPFPSRLSPAELRKLKPAYRVRPSRTRPGDWRTCGQCRDCFMPAFQYVFDGSVQKALASAWFGGDGRPAWFRFGFIGSTDTHASRPGSVMEEKQFVELRHARGSGFLYRASQATGLSVAGMGASGREMFGFERIAHYLNAGGLVAALAPRRTREDLWQALRDRHVYATSGPRIEVRLEVAADGRAAKMGDAMNAAGNPVFRLRARGAPAENGTCRYDDRPDLQAALSRAEFGRVCYHQCYNPLGARTRIARVEVVKILQPLTPEEAAMPDLRRSAANPRGLIIDPVHVERFGQEEIDWSWEDGQFTAEPAGRSVAYYFRVIQEATPGYNCDPGYRLERGELCDNRYPRPDAVAETCNPQDNAEPRSRLDLPDACYTSGSEPETGCQERAWTSPVYLTRQ